MTIEIFCPDCLHKVESKGSPFRRLLEAIIEGYYLTDSPVAIRNDMGSDYILEYMEKGRYIITTEFKDPENENRDLVLALPIGHFRCKDEGCFFCFDSENHS